MKWTMVYMFLSGGLIVGSTVWSGCYTQLAIGSDNTASEVEPDSTVIDQMTAFSEAGQSVFINDPWIVAPFALFYFPPSLAGSRYHKSGVVSTYLPVPFTGTPAASSSAETPAPSTHRESGYQRSSAQVQNNSRTSVSTPPRTSQGPARPSSPSVPATRTPTASVPATRTPAASGPATHPPAASAPAAGTPATSAPPANNRAGGATRTGR